MHRSTVLVAAALAFCGCTASLEGKRVAGSPPAARETERGLTYYLSKPQFTIDVKGQRDKKKAEPVYELKLSSVADYGNRYEVRLKSGWLTNDKLSLKLTDDGRIQSFGATSEDEIGSLIKPLGSLAAAVARVSLLGAASKGRLVPTALTKAVNKGFIKQPDHDNAVCVYRKLYNVAPLCPSLDLGKAKVTVMAVIARWETALRGRFERGCFQLDNCPEDNLCSGTAGTITRLRARSCSLADQRDVRDLKKFLGKIEGALPSLAKELKKLQEEARKAYLRYVTDPSFSRVQFQMATKAYADAVGRLLEFDQRRLETGTLDRHSELLAHLRASLPTNPTGNESKAYTDYREELDQLVAGIGTRWSAAVPAKKKQESLPEGTVVTRTLDEIVQFEIANQGNLLENTGQCFEIADLWVRYGGKDAVVFTDNLGTDDVSSIATPRCWQ